MLLLTAADVRGLLTMPDAIAAARQALVLHARGACDVPLRTHLGVPQHHGQALFMPAHVPEIGALGIKVVSVFPDNAALGRPTVPGTVLLLDARTGAAVALMDGTYLTAMRTGAVQGAATAVLARTDARIGALIGTGGQAASQLEAMLCARPLTQVRVFSRDLALAKAFVERVADLAARYGAQVVAVDLPESAVEGADVVTTVTTSPVPVLDASAVGPGTHVNGVGAYTPAMQELPGDLVARADLVVVDTPAALDEAGDLLRPIAAGLVDPSGIVALGEILDGRAPGRTGDEQTTVFKSVGSAVLDVVTAHRVYEAAIEAGVGHTFDL